MNADLNFSFYCRRSDGLERIHIDYFFVDLAEIYFERRKKRKSI